MLNILGIPERHPSRGDGVISAFGIELDSTTVTDPIGRPRFLVDDGASPIAESI
jgi:cyanate lyase